MMKKICPTQLFHLQKIIISLSTLVFVTACASTPPPVAQMAISRTAVHNADSAGSIEFAPLQLKSAIEKMTDAERAMKDKKYLLARQLAEQAQVDSELAVAMTRSGKAQKAADALQEDSRVLKQEIDHKSQ
jgi:hypothetical protein